MYARTYIYNKRGYNIPNADVLVADTFVEMSNLLDLTVEDNVQ